jgi:NAD(P)-dependent dehydrogenase (short-subunit alcohol dehydrogenase family)
MTGKPGFKKGAVVVTGASTGIGKARVLHLDGLGFRVFAGVRNVQDGDSLKRESAERITPVLLDVTDGTAVVAAAGDVAKAVGAAGLSGQRNLWSCATRTPPIAGESSKPWRRNAQWQGRGQSWFD